MTTINCTSNCTYQDNGKCALQNVQSITSSATEDCAYFTVNEKKEKKMIDD